MAQVGGSLSPALSGHTSKTGKSFRGAYATKELRKREYLMPGEVARLLRAAGKLGRHGASDENLLLLAYRHGLRVSEHDQVDCSRERHSSRGNTDE
jgi:hypothetical protein